MAYVTIGKSVTNIGNNAFNWCSNLKTIACLNLAPPQIEESTFSSYSATLQVPSDSKTAYQNAEYWKNFTNIVEIDPSAVQSIIMDNDSNTPVYDLTGRRLNVPRKGINIIGVKKVLKY